MVLTPRPLILWCGLVICLLVSSPAIAQQNEPAAEEQRTYFTTNFSAEEINLETLNSRLSYIGLEFPAELQGVVSTNLQLRIPVGDFRNTRAYRASGTLTSEQLTIAGVAVTGVRVELQYLDGKLTLTELTIKLPALPAAEGEDPAQPGTITGLASFDILPPAEAEGDADAEAQRNLRIKISFDQLPVGRLATAAGDLELSVRGRLSGTVRGSAPVDRLGDLTAWKVLGDARLTRLAVGERVVEQATSDFYVNEGAAVLKELAISSGDLQFKGRGMLQLTDEFGFSADGKLTLPALGDDNPLLPELADSDLQLDGLSATAEVSGNLNPLSYNMTGQVQVSEVGLPQLAVSELDAQYNVSEGQLELEELSGKLASGSLSGQGTLRWQGDEPTQAQLELAGLQLADLLEPTVGEGTELPRGHLAGTLRLSIPQGAFAEPARWGANAELSLKNGRYQNLPPFQLAAEAELQELTLKLTELRGQLAKAEFAGEATLGLTGKLPVTAKVQSEELDLVRLEPLLNSLGVPGTLQGEAQLLVTVDGQAEPFDGEIVISFETGAGVIFDADIRDLALAVAVTPKLVEIREFAGKVAGGTVSAEGKFPLDGAEPGRLAVEWEKIDLGQYAAQFIRPEAPLHAPASGQVSLIIPAEERANVDAWPLEGEIKLPEITVDEKSVGQLAGEIDRENGLWTYALTGTLFEGEIDLRGELPLELFISVETLPAEPNEPPADEAPAPDQAAAASGRWRIKNLPLAPLARLWLGPKATVPSGTLGLNFRYQQAAPGERLLGGGDFVIANLAYGDQVLSKRLPGEITYGGGLLRVEDLRGSYAQGRARLSALIDLAHPQRSVAELTLRRADVEEALVWVPDVLGYVTGTATLVARASFSNGIKVAADVMLEDAIVVGLSLGTVRLPISYSSNFSGTVQTLRVPETTEAVARGRARASLLLSIAPVLSLETEIYFNRVDMAQLLGGYLSEQAVGNARATGRLTFSGSRIRTAQDVAGTVDLSFGQVAGPSLPVLGALRGYLNPLGFGSSRFTGGSLEAVLSRGVWFINEFYLQGERLQLTADGTVTTAGVLDLDVVAATVSFREQGLLLRVLLSRIPVAGPVPVGVLLQLTELLTDRIIHLGVTGTVNRPRVNLLPAATLRAEIRRQLVNQALISLGIPAPGGIGIELDD